MEKRYRRKAASEFLRALGLPVAAATLAKKAVTGGGPEFETWGGRIPLYRESALVAWAQDQLSGPRRSTSDNGRRAGA